MNLALGTFLYGMITEDLRAQSCHFLHSIRVTVLDQNVKAIVTIDLLDLIISE